MFKTNNFEDSIIIEEFENSKIFIIDNFYVDPYRILNFINSVNLLLHKKHASPSYNGIHFPVLVDSFHRYQQPCAV